MKLKDAIGFDPKRGQFVLGTHTLKGKPVEGNTMAASTLEQEADALMAHLGELARDDHLALAQTIVEPIEQVVPYAEMYNVFFMDQSYGDREDNALPVEDTVTIAWETHQDGAARPVRSGFSWTRPGFVTYDTAMEVPWWMTRKAGWDFFSRQMRRAVEDLARKRDERASDIFTAALLPAQVVTTVAGGLLTKAAINTVVKNAADQGFPVTQALVNPGTLKDMTDFVWPVGLNLPDNRAEQLITNLYLTDYAGISWFVNPMFPTNRVRISGPRNTVGWHQTRGVVRNSSDIDIINKRDLYLIEDQEHAWYIGNSVPLWEIRIAA